MTNGHLLANIIVITRLTGNIISMVILVTYILIALGFSFLCSIAEAVLLSVTTGYVVLLENEGKPSGAVLRELKDNIQRPLAAVLTLNTIAHTIGAAGAGAQAAAVYGSGSVGIVSAVLTLCILIFSEIIPKTLGVAYWRTLAPVTGYGLRVLVWLLYPFVILSGKITGGLSREPTLTGFSRAEITVMAEVSAREGQLAERESMVLKNLLLMSETRVKDVMTPRTVVFSLPQDMIVEDFFLQFDGIRFSRIPVYGGEKENVLGFVLRSDLLLAQVRGNVLNSLATYRREMATTLSMMSMSQAFDEFLRQRTHIMLVVDEYGDVEGILTLEDVLETLLGLEIIDESDKNVDMQKLARNLWKRRAREMGLDIEDDPS